jgi:phosphate transport system protein
MPRKKFDEQLAALNEGLIEMGALVEAAIREAARSLMERDVASAIAVVANDDAVNRQERQIEDLCIRLLIQQQPVASDLRLISAALKMAGDMERIGDQAADISEIVITLGGAVPVEYAADLPEMAAAAIAMVGGAIDAFVKGDIDGARAVVRADDRVDELFNVVRSELIEHIRRDGDGVSGDVIADLLMVVKYLERIGDHAQNIADWVEYSITGFYKGAPLG